MGKDKNKPNILTRERVKEIVWPMNFLEHLLFKPLFVLNRAEVGAVLLQLLNHPQKIEEFRTEAVFELLGAKSIRPDVVFRTTNGLVSIDLQLDNSHSPLPKGRSL